MKYPGSSSQKNAHPARERESNCHRQVRYAIVVEIVHRHISREASGFIRNEWLERPITVADQDIDLSVGEICHRNVRLVVAIEVSDCRVQWIKPGRKWQVRLKSSIAVAQENLHFVAQRARNCQIEFVVAVKVRRHNAERDIAQL